MLTSERHDCGSADYVSGGRETADRVVGDGAGERHGFSGCCYICVLVCGRAEGVLLFWDDKKVERVEDEVSNGGMTSKCSKRSWAEGSGRMTFSLINLIGRSKTTSYRDSGQ